MFQDWLHDEIPEYLTVSYKGQYTRTRTKVVAPCLCIFYGNLELLTERQCWPVQVRVAVRIDIESVLGSPPSGECIVGQHRSTEVVMAVWSRQAKLDKDILTMVDGAHKGQASRVGLGCWKGPWATVGGLVGFSSNYHSHCCSFGFELWLFSGNISDAWCWQLDTWQRWSYCRTQQVSRFYAKSNTTKTGPVISDNYRNFTSHPQCCSILPESFLCFYTSKIKTFAWGFFSKSVLVGLWQNTGVDVETNPWLKLVALLGATVKNHGYPPPSIKKV